MVSRHSGTLPPPQALSRSMRNGKSRASRALWSTSNVSWTARRWRFLGLAVGRETSNVCVHPEKERERMKCSLADIEGLSAQIGNLGNVGFEELDQTWRVLFGSERPRRVYGDLLIKALGYPLQEKAIRGLTPSTLR